MFKWGVAEELVPPGVYHGLQSGTGLRAGRCQARESRAVKPVVWAVVERTLPHMSRQVGAMVRLQALTGMRSGEVVVMRGGDIEAGGPVWLYRPPSQKTAHHGKERVVALGPQAQQIVREFLKLDTQAYLFSPVKAEQERRAALRAKRKTPESCGNRPGSMRRAKPRKQPGSRYTTSSYLHAVKKAIAKADRAAREQATAEALAGGHEPPREVFVPDWHPHQLRHLHASEVRRRYGLEAAQVALGHAQANVTEVYAERNLGLACPVAAEIG